MRKIKMNCQESITVEERCNLYLQNCKKRNLREDTIRHYRQSYLRFYRYFERTMPLKEMNLQKYMKMLCSFFAEHFCFRNRNLPAKASPETSRV